MCSCAQVNVLLSAWSKNNSISLHLFDRAAKGKDVCLVRQSNFNFLNLPSENWVETVLLLIANLQACCQVLLNMSLQQTTLQVCRFMGRSVFVFFKHAKHKTKLSLHGDDTWRCSPVFWWSGSLYTERSSQGSFYGSREMVFPQFHLLGLPAVCTLPWTVLWDAESQMQLLLNSSVQAVLPRPTSASCNRHCNCLLLFSKASISI